MDYYEEGDGAFEEGASDKFFGGGGAYGKAYVEEMEADYSGDGGGYAEGDGAAEEEEADGWREVAAAPLWPADAPAALTCLRFDAADEALWAGTAGGHVVQALALRDRAERLAA